jgi:hypothetical protein
VGSAGASTGMTVDLLEPAAFCGAVIEAGPGGVPAFYNTGTQPSATSPWSCTLSRSSKGAGFYS